MQIYKQKLVSFFKLISVLFIVNNILLLCGCEQKPTSREAVATEVIVFSAFAKKVVTDFDFMGHTEPSKTVNIVSRITGTLTKINFKEGNKVQQGDLLFEIDPISYQIAVAQAKAGLAGKVANMVLSIKEYERTLELYKGGNLSQSKLDLAAKQKNYTTAIVDAAREEVKKAEVNLSYAKITAPFDGVIGESKYSVGNLLSPESGSLAILVDTDTIQVRFYIKEKQVLKFVAAKNSVTELTNGITIDLLDPNTNKIILKQGSLVYLSPIVDKMSAMLTAKAEFINSNAIVPGLYAKLLISKKEEISKIVVPKHCVLDSQLGKFVWVVNSNNQAQKRYIKIASNKNNFSIVEEGLVQGDKVIIEGIQKVYQDALVSPVEVEIDQNTATIISSPTRK
jgi:membrane fusion protein (multidrug efflux system)